MRLRWKPWVCRKLENPVWSQRIQSCPTRPSSTSFFTFLRFPLIQFEPTLDENGPAFGKKPSDRLRTGVRSILRRRRLPLLRFPSESLYERLRARPKLQTGLPFDMTRTSGSRVRLPISRTLFREAIEGLEFQKSRVASILLYALDQHSINLFFQTKFIFEPDGHFGIARDLELQEGSRLHFLALGVGKVMPPWFSTLFTSPSASRIISLSLIISSEVPSAPRAS